MPVPPPSAGAQYLGLIANAALAGGIVLAWLAVAAFYLMTGTWPPNAGAVKVCNSLVFGGALLYAATRCWRTIRAREDEHESRFARRHRYFRRSGTAVAALAVAAATVWGVSQGRAVRRQRDMDALRQQMDDLHLERIGRQVVEVRKPVSTIEEFYRSRLREEEMLDEWEPRYMKCNRLLEQFAALAKGDAALTAQVETLRAITAMNSEWIAAARNEVNLTKALALRPEEDRLAYYQSMIEPVEQRLDRISAKQAALLKQVQAGD
jgi:hypothetical protein